MTFFSDTISLINAIIKETHDAEIFSHKCYNTASLLLSMRNEIAHNQHPKEIGQEDLLKINENLKNIFNIIRILSNKEQYISYISNNSFQKVVLDINKYLNLVINLLNKYDFLNGFKIGPEDNDLYRDFVFIDELLADPKYQADQLIQQRRKEIEENFKQIQKPENDDNNTNDEDNFAELNQNYHFKLYPTDYVKGNLYIDDPEKPFIYYFGEKKSNPKEKLKIMVLKDKSKFKRIFSILAHIHHPYLETFVGASINNSDVEIVTRKVGVNLRKLLSINKDDNDIYDDGENHDVFLESGDRTIIAFKIAQAMAYLHSHGVIHRDLNTTNIFITKCKSGNDILEVNPIITNFANSRLLFRNSILNLTIIHIESSSTFAAPELTDTPNYDEKVDVFAFSGILYELLTSYKPFEESIEGSIDILKKLKDGKRPIIPKSCSKELRQLIENCWKQDPRDRPSFHKIISTMLPKEGRGMIIFPSDETKSESIKKFYDQYIINSNIAKECLETFEMIKDNIGSTCQYRFEFFRARPFISNYQYLLYNSQYPSKKEFNSEENTKMTKLSNDVKQLLEIVLNATPIRWKKISQTSNVDLITNQLNEKMNEIYETMKNLEIKVIEKYQEKENDIVFDYRQLLNDFDNYIVQIRHDYENFNESEISHANHAIDSYTKRKKEIVQFLRSRNLLGGKTDEVLKSQIKDLLAQYSKYELNIDNYDLYEDYEEGMSSEVHCAYDKINEKEVAVKIIRENYLKIGEASMIALSREISNLTRIKNEYIAEFIGYCVPDDKLTVWLIFEYVPNGPINEYNLNGYERTKIAFEIAEAMEHIHSKRILHRDLKPKNILLDDNLSPKIIDFGTSRSDINDTEKTLDVGTIRYMAPEIIEGGCYGAEADVYSFAMILWELEYKKCPFINLNTEQYKYDIVNGNAKLDFKQNCPDELKSLIIDCSDIRPNKRPSFTEIIERMMKKEEYVTFSNTDYNKISSFYEEKAEKRKKMNID